MMRRAIDLLLVGGGHAMLPTLEGAASWPVASLRVTLVNAGRHLYYSGMIPEHLGGVYADRDARVDLAALCRRRGIRFVDGRATHLDRDARTVTTTTGDPLPYDVVAFDVGGVNPARPEAAVPTKPLGRVQELERRLRATLAAPSGGLALAVAGGGAAGTEIALNVSGRFEGHGRLGDLDCTVVEPGPRLLSTFPEGMSRRAHALLERRGVRVVTGSELHWDGTASPTLDDGTPVEADEVLWATGTVGLPLFREAGLPCEARDYVRVLPSLRTTADPRVFAAGDCASIAGLEHLGRVGVHAVKQGPVLRDNLRRAVAAVADGHDPATAPLEAFAPYPVAPLILSTGRREGLWSANGLWLRGELLLRLKHLVDRRWIRRYQPDGRFAGASWIALADAAAPA